MQSRATRQFWRLFSDLRFDVQRDAKRKSSLPNNPAHLGLQFKKLDGEDDVYSARISLDYRALAVMKKGCVAWFFGSAEYDRLIKYRQRWRSAIHLDEMPLETHSSIT